MNEIELNTKLGATPLQNIKCGIGKLIEFPENSNLIKQKID
jgi:hypothetical protein